MFSSRLHEWAARRGERAGTNGRIDMASLDQQKEEPRSGRERKRRAGKSTSGEKRRGEVMEHRGELSRPAHRRREESRYQARPSWIPRLGQKPPSMNRACRCCIARPMPTKTTTSNAGSCLSWTTTKSISQRAEAWYLRPLPRSVSAAVGLNEVGLCSAAAAPTGRSRCSQGRLGRPDKLTARWLGLRAILRRRDSAARARSVLAACRLARCRPASLVRFPCQTAKSGLTTPIPDAPLIPLPPRRMPLRRCSPKLTISFETSSESWMN